MSDAQTIARRWKITGVLGEGGMGDVYQGLDLETGETVAIKLLKPDIVDAMPSLVDRFKREIALLHQLNHPNIVRILGAVEEDGLHYLIMEYMPGGSLKDLLQAQSPLPIKRILEIALDLADALTRAHRLQVIHRDLKPANVLLAADGTPRLTDFGIAHVANSTSMTQSGMLVGTLEYVSPEACRGQALDARSDIWSFGVMLYEMLTRQKPFERELVAATLTAVLNDPVPDLEALRPDAPVALIDLIYRMLEKNRDHRISSMRLVGMELESILLHEGRPPQAAAPPRPAFVRAIFKHDLSMQSAPFVGREADLGALERLMSNPQFHLVTIAAPGGIGKTRLALEYAARQVGRFANGVYFISLAGLSRTEDIVLAIADAIHVVFTSMKSHQEQLLAFLSSPDEQQMLLVLDNFEHVLDSAPLISDLLQAAPDIKILTTSRARLNLSGEVVFELGGMEVPEGLSLEELRQHGTIKLFEINAQRVQPNFELKTADLPHVLKICRSVFGNPLGIVLAAAWIELLSPEEIAQEVELSLDFLQTDARDVPERQRSLRAVFESSWNMLTDAERDVFMKLSIFRGGVKRSIAQYITGASLQTLAALVKKSLARRDTDTGRYEIHELLRQYAAEALEKSGQAQATRDIHSHFFMSLAARHAIHLRGQSQVEAIREIDTDFENLRSAWSWAVQRQNAGLVAVALDGVFLFCMLTGEYEELAGLMGEARTRFSPQADPALWQRAAIRLELARTPKGDPQQIERLLALARAAGDRAEEAFCLWTLAYAASGAGRYAEAVRLFRESLALYQELDDPFFVGRAMSDVGLFCAVIGAHEESAAFLMQSGTMQSTLGDLVGAAQSKMRMSLNLPL